MKTIEDLDKGTIRRIDWQELFPGLLLFRALILSLRFIPIAVGSLLVITIFPNLWTGSDFYHNPLPNLFSTLSKVDFEDHCSLCFFRQMIPQSAHPRLVLLGIVILLFFFGLAVSRKFAVRLASTERVSFLSAVRFAFCRFPSLLLAAIIPILGIAAAKVIFGLISLNGFLYLIGSPFLIILAWLTVLLLLGLHFGLPIMTASIAADKSDGFDAFSKTFSYLFQRPFHFLFYLVLGVILGLLGFEIVFYLSRGILAVFCNVNLKTDAVTNPSSCLLQWGVFWIKLLCLAPYGFLSVYLFTAATAIYFALRRSVDGIAFDHFVKESNETPHRLRPITADAQGAPIMAENKTEKENEESQETTSVINDANHSLSAEKEAS